MMPLLCKLLQKEAMIVVTGAAGFIGSYLIHRLNQDNFNAIIAVDKFDNAAKNNNLTDAKIKERVDRDLFLAWLDKNYENVEFIFHIGARTDTAEFDLTLLLQNLILPFCIRLILNTPKKYGGVVANIRFR